MKIPKTINEENLNKKLCKILKTKIKKIKKRSQRRDSNLYDINNFVVQNNTNKINEKKDFKNIPIPVYRELEEDYYATLPDEEESRDLELNSDIINNVNFVLIIYYLRRLEIFFI